MTVPRVEEVNQALSNIEVPDRSTLDFTNNQWFRDIMLIQAILAVGAEINMLRIALNTNSTDLEECVNRIVDESVRVVMSETK